MINQVYRLVSPRQFEVKFDAKGLKDAELIVRPKYLSICAADQRYYTGSRGEKVLEKKLPMALIHEGVGTIVYDKTNTYEIGTNVVIVPNKKVEVDEFIAENYLPSSQFSSSGFDGFMQDYLFVEHDRVVELPKEINLEVAAITELVTIATHSISRFEMKSINRRGTFGVWGDGNLGFITSLLLKKLYPNCKVIVFGKTDYKLSHFSFVDGTINISNIPQDIEIDHAFECVGGKGSEVAINQIIDLIKPEGTISILGVSEFNVEINTRMVLEKGLIIIGSSRSGLIDFQKTVAIYNKYPEIPKYLLTIIANVREVRSIEDIKEIFNSDLSLSWGKTIMKWEI